MRPSFPSIFEHLISKPRLDSYKGYFHTKNLNESIGLYMWNLELSACFGTLISFFEIALRNSVHRTMSQFYSRGASSSDHWYDRIRQSLKPATVSKIDALRHEGSWRSRTPRHPPPSPDEIVSRVSFGFWPGVLSSIDIRYAGHIFPRIFPDHPLNATPLDWTVKGIRKNALSFVFEINDFRKRLAHHEPLWKFAAIKDTSVNPPVTIVPASASLADSLVRYQRFLTRFDETMRAMNQDFYTDLIQSSWRKKLDYLLSPRGIARYRTLKHCPATDSLTPTGLRRAFQFIVDNNQPIRVKCTGGNGLFTPD